MAASRTRSASNVLLALLLVSVVWVGYTASQATATHEPANKGAAAGSDIDEVSDARPILTETFKVSSQEDMIVNVTSECSILTSLLTQGGADVPEATGRVFGQVELFVTLDGRVVPVDALDGPGSDVGDPEDESVDAQEQGEVVFCNRAYQRTIQDAEEGMDGIDTERDYIRTRSANAFNWLAVDIGFDYDDSCVGADPALTTDTCLSTFTGNGNNIILAELWAEFESSDPHPATTDDPETPEDESRCPIEPGAEVSCTEAFVGSRTMILEPIKLSIHEQVERDDTDGGS